MNQKTQVRTNVSHLVTPATITMGASGARDHFVENVLDIHSLVEQILTADGQKAQAKSIAFHCRIYSTNVFGIIPCVIQTAGTLTDTVDLDANTIQDKNLDVCIDDVFGYQNLSPLKMARRVPPADPTSGSSVIFGLEFTQVIPGNLLYIVNKEAETERLQNLIFAFYGIARDNSQVITTNVIVEVKFTGLRKTIKLR